MADIATSTSCNDKPGIVTVFATTFADVDWTAMALAANYDDATHTVTTWVMSGAGAWSEFTFEKKPSQLIGTYTSANGYYEVQLLNLLFNGKTAARSVIIGNLLACCNVVLQIHDSNGLARVVGAEYVEGAWTPSLKSGRVTRHLDTTGAFGTEDDRARDEIDFGAEHINPLPFSSVGIATMRTL